MPIRFVVLEVIQVVFFLHVIFLYVTLSVVGMVDTIVALTIKTLGKREQDNKRVTVLRKSPW
jgi:hypothetical protein